MNLNPEHVKILIEWVNAAPYFNNLDMKVKNIGNDSSEVETVIAEKHLSVHRGLHGSTYASLLESATYWACYGAVPEDAGLITLDLNCNYLRNVKQGRLITRGKLLKAGRNVCLCEARITGEDGKLAATGTSNIMVTHNLQNIISERVKQGFPPLPPKYLPD
jgi:uncharacterized protein (TIGR00369 family)